MSASNLGASGAYLCICRLVVFCDPASVGCLVVADENKTIRRLAAVLVADVAGYSRLMEQDEAGTLQALKARWREILEPLVRERSGRVVKYMGDGVLVEFSSALNAVNCALDLQSRMAEANSATSIDRRIVLRVGLTLGDLIEDGKDIYGDGVNIAARLEALADPGAICLSGKLYDEVRGKLKVAADDLGEVALKNITTPVRAYGIKPDARQPSLGGQIIPNDARGQTSIAVLPFINLSGAAEQDYFADGITEDLITELSRNEHLSVRSQNTTAAYKTDAMSISEIGRKLNIDFLVTGKVRRLDNRVRLTAQLTDTESGANVWADKFDREIGDIFSAQDEIVTAILARLTFNLDDAAADQRRRKPTTSATAYSYFLQARSAWRRRGDENEARNCLLSAVAVDPHYCRALAYLSFFFGYSRFSLTAGLEDQVAIREARHYAERAVSADPDVFALHRCAMAYTFIGEPISGRRLIETAVARSPRELEVMQAHGFILALCGQHAEGLAWFEKAAKLEPVLPPGFRAGLSDVRYLCGDYQGALDALEPIVDPAPYVRLCQAACLGQLGHIEEARRRVASVASRQDGVRFATCCASMCALPQDAEHWLAGFRKAGIDV